MAQPWQRLDPAWEPAGANPPVSSAHRPVRQAQGLLPASLEHFNGDYQVPGAHDPARAGRLVRHGRLHPMGVLGRERGQRAEVRLVQSRHEIAVLVQEEPDLGRGRRVVQQSGVGDHQIQVQELHRLEAPPDLLPVARQVGPLQAVHQGALHAGHADPDSPMMMLGDREVLPSGPNQGGREAAAAVNLRVEPEPARHRLRRGVDPVVPKVVGPAVEGHGRVMRHHRVRGQLGRDVEAVHLVVTGVAAGWHDGVEALPYPLHPSGLRVVREEGLPSPGPDRAVRG